MNHAPIGNDFAFLPAMLCISNGMMALRETNRMQRRSYVYCADFFRGRIRVEGMNHVIIYICSMIIQFCGPSVLAPKMKDGKE